MKNNAIQGWRNKANKILLLREMHIALQQPGFFFFSFFCQPYPKYDGIWSKKHVYIDHQTANTIQLFVPIKRNFWGSMQQRRILQGLLDKYRHLFICISLKQTLSSGQKPVYTVKIVISEQIAFATAFYFGQVFVFCRLINKSVLEWFLLIMCK